LLVVDHDGRIVRANQRIQLSFGYTPLEVVGERIESLVPIDLATLRRVHTEDYFEHPETRGMAADSDVHGRRKDGSEFPADISLSPLQSGGELQVLASLRDITERKQAEEALRQSEERFRRIFEDSPLGLLLATPDFRMMKSNESFRRMLGYSDADLEFLTPLDITHPDDRDENRKLNEALLAGKIPSFKIEKRYLKKNREIIWATLTATAIRDREGRVLYALGIIEDITERKHAEQKLAEQAALLDLAHDAILVCDLNGTIRFWSRGAKDTYGWSADKAVGRVSHELLQTEFPVDYEEVLAILLAKGGWEGELVHTTREGKKLIMASRWSLQRDETGAPHSILQINRDITARKRLEEQVETGREQAAAAARLSALGMMAGGVAHEINNPLAIIHALASDLTEQVDEHETVPAEVVGRSSRRIVETTERIAHIVKSLRKISREGTKDRYYPVRIGKILEETLEITRARFEARGVRLILPDAIPALTVSVREVQIEQVVLNLLQNAFDAVVDQPGEPWVRVDVTSREGAAVVSVIDSGPGIPLDLRDYIGQPFFTTKEVGKGAGLGLSLSRTIAEEHGGRIEYDEDSGHTRFSLVLPLARQAEAA
jgi:PAS domain S-box-containing protein